MNRDEARELLPGSGDIASEARTAFEADDDWEDVGKDLLEYLIDWIAGPEEPEEDDDEDEEEEEDLEEDDPDEDEDEDLSPGEADRQRQSEHYRSDQ